MRKFDHITRRLERLTDASLAREIRATEDRLDDVKNELYRWGFARTPSEKRRLREDIVLLEERLEWLRGMA
jgi:hypothetical protein